MCLRDPSFFLDSLQNTETDLYADVADTELGRKVVYTLKLEVNASCNDVMHITMHLFFSLVGHERITNTSIASLTADNN